MSEKTDKILRELNERLDRDANTVKGMSKEEKRVFAIVIFAVALIAIGLTWAFAATSEFEMDIRCVADKCTVNKDDLKRLIAHNNAVTLKLESMSKCKSWTDS